LIIYSTVADYYYQPVIPPVGILHPPNPEPSIRTSW
jgi:hypothetical protein